MRGAPQPPPSRPPGQTTLDAAGGSGSTRRGTGGRGPGRRRACERARSPNKQYIFINLFSAGVSLSVSNRNLDISLSIWGFICTLCEPERPR